MRISFRSLLPVLLLVIAPGSFGAGRQLTGVYAPAATAPLPPEEAAKKMTLPDGFEARIFAFEPQVVNPVGMTWDDRGRLWVVELYEYPLGAPAGTKPRDNIKILEDTDNDGRADKVTVFADGLNLATGILLGYGGAFVGQAPHLLFLEDTNGDDKADKTTILKTGFGLEDRHELLNGFTWGPDGQLYMTHGVFTFSKVKNPDDPNDDGVTMTAAVARYHPRTKKFEVYAEGTSNPWGVDFDRTGNAFVSACVIDHLFHMAPGGLYQRQAGTPPYPYAYELLPSIVDHKHFRAAYAGLQVYQGDQYPAEYRGTVMMGNIHDSSIHQDKLTPNGSSFKASFMKDFVRANDGWFRPVSTQVGPDGALWIMDWYDKYPCYQNANADPEGVDRAHGRIWRIVYTGNEKGKAVPSHPEGLNLSKAPTAELVRTLGHANVWQRRTAQRILSERRDGASRELLLASVRQSKNPDERLAAFWTLQSAGQLKRADLLPLAADSDPAIRTWVARFVGETGDSSDDALEMLRVLAEDADPAVRLAVVTSARLLVSGSLTVNMPPARELEGDIGPVLATAFLQEASAKDPLIPFILWMAVEPRFATDPAPALDWLAGNAMSNPALGNVILRKMARRLADTGSAEKIGMLLEFLANLGDDAAPITLGTIDGLIEGQKGRAYSPDAAASALLSKLQKHPNRDVVARSRQLGALWGDAAALDASLKAVADGSKSAEERVQAIQSVRQQKAPSVRDALVRLIATEAPETVVNAAMQALGEFGADDTPDHFLKQWKTLKPSSRRIGAEVLSSRSKWAQRLISSLENKSVAIGDVPVTVVRALTTAKDDYVRNRAVQVIGKFRESSPDKNKLIAEKKQVIMHGPVNLEKGREIAQRTCFTCHKLHGEGAEIGPDLTGVGRSSLDALLANIIDPNQLIGAGYENVEVNTKDDRVVAGRMVENTDTRVKILSLGPKEEVVAKANIESIRVSEMSVMPEGLEQMPDEDFRNLIWYLFNPPQDDKAILVYPGEKQLIVKAKVPGRSDYADLITYAADPALRPYLHPVKDPSGSTVLTQDKPDDHPWQHGIFTGLHKVNGIDFWSEKQGQQRFRRFLDIAQEQDHVSWRSLTEWVRPDGGVEVEEEQFVKVYAVTGPSHYTVDFDWTLRAKDKPVTIGKHEYGGFAVRLDFNPKHSHLNSKGQRDKETSDQRAAWCNVAREFGGQTYGVVVYDHPSNLGHPAMWRVDGQGLINPSPSMQGDWTIDRGGSRTFRYRLSVHAGAGEAQAFDTAFKGYSALAYSQSAADSTDGESIALWNPEWKLTAPNFENTPQKLPEFAGKRNVLLTHPYGEQKPSFLERVVKIPADKRTLLTFNAAAHENGDWELRVFANDQLIKKQIIDKSGDRWKSISVDLTPYAGKEIKLRLENAANNWSWEFGYWQDVKLNSL